MTQTNGNGDGPVASYRDREAWLPARQSGIGGSDAPDVVKRGFHGEDGQRRVWESKVGGPEVDRPKSGDLKRGIRQEENGVDLFVEETGYKVRRQPMRRHKRYPFIIGDIDRQIIGHENGTGILEVKVPRTNRFFEIRDLGLNDSEVIQLHHYLMVYDYSWGAFAVYNPEYDEALIFEIDRDDSLCDWLLQEEKAFWYEYVEPRIVPPYGNGAVPPSIPKAPGAALVRHDAEWGRAVDSYIKTEAEFERARMAHEAALSDLTDLASSGDPDRTYHVAGHGLTIKRDSRNGRVTFDHKLLKAYGALDPKLVEKALGDMKECLNAGQLDELDGLLNVRAGGDNDDLSVEFSAFEKQGDPYFTKPKIHVTAPAFEDEEPTDFGDPKRDDLMDEARSQIAEERALREGVA
jgi:hypothetical protein